jgi:hypothetical protein
MSDRRPTDDELLLEALEAVRAGNGAAAAAGARLAHDKALQAELEGLKAVQELLKADADWGAQSGADAPPPHLLDAILRAEVAAREDAIRSAVAASASVGANARGAAPAPPATSWWSRFSSWVVGGGVVVGAAAALLVTVTRAPADVAAPKAAEAPAQLAPVTAASMDTDTGTGTGTGTTPPPTPPQDTMALAEPPGAAAGGGGLLEQARQGEQKLAAAMPTEGAADKADRTDAPLERSIGGLNAVAEAAVGDGVVDGIGGGRRARETGAAQKDAASGAARAGPTHDDDALAMPIESDAAPAPEPAPASGMTSTAPSAAPSAAPSSPAAAPPPKPIRIVSADEARKNFLEARAKAEAKAQAMELAIEEAKGTARGTAKSAPAAAKKSAREDAGAARDQMAREQRLQEANGVLVAAERELQFGRFAAALDLAQRAEAIAGTGLGLAPASTQTRAYLGLKRFADAARLGSRLLQGPAVSPWIVDGLLAGAEAATAIGDVRLAERLLTKAASTENPDAARRAEARRRLQALSGKATAPSKAKAREAEAAPATTSSDAP